MDKNQQIDNAIGTATMEPDGTIVLHLRTQEEGPIGIGRMTYPPDHESYEEVLKHLGGLAPGVEKLVPPWPEE